MTSSSRSKAQSRIRRKVRAIPDIDGVWWVVIDPTLARLAGPYTTRSDAVYIKNAIQEVLDSATPTTHKGKQSQ